MNLRPDLRQPLIKAWAIFGGIVVVCLLILWWLADDGDLGTRLDTARSEQHKLSGDVDLAKRIVEQKTANQTLLNTIVTLKSATSMQVVPPFLVPANHPQPGQYFNEQFAAVQDYLRDKARDKGAPYNERLGFAKKPNGVPADSEAAYLLEMLQLTRKAADIVLSSPTPIQRFDITQPSPIPVLTGPAGRPPLLKEYPLKITVVGSLKDLLWILHQFAQRQNEQDFPLIVRKLTVDSQNLKPGDEIQQLTAVFEVAAMRFLTDDERAAGDAAKPAAGGRGL